LWLFVLQIICITMMALALAEDSLSKRERCNEIIDELGKLSEKMRAFMQVGQALHGRLRNSFNLTPAFCRLLTILIYCMSLETPAPGTVLVVRLNDCRALDVCVILRCSQFVLLLWLLCTTEARQGHVGIGC
jgi:hypothetical protein